MGGKSCRGQNIEPIHRRSNNAPPRESGGEHRTAGGLCYGRSTIEKNGRGSRWIIVGLEFGTVTGVLRDRLNPPHAASLEMTERREESSEVRKGRWTLVCYPISGIRV